MRGIHKNIFLNLSKIALLCFFCLIFVLNPQTSYSATLNDLKNQQQDVNKEIEEKKSKLQSKESELNQITDEINGLSYSISLTQSKINEVASQIDNLASEIAKNEEEIAIKQRELDEQYENQAETLRTIYESYKYSNPIRMIIGASSLSQLLNYNTYLEALQDKIENTMAEINRIKSDLENKKQDLEKNKKDQESLYEQEKAYKRGLEDQKSQKDQMAVSKEEEKKSLEEQLEEYKATKAKLDAQIAAAIAAATRNNSVGGITAKDKGVSAVGFMWPTNGVITAYYNDPEYLAYFGFPHYGLDIANIPGTPIYASASGTVSTVAYIGSYGNCIIIAHNARYVSLYAHMQGFAVSPGDEVSQGQVIGYMGSTGFSTGPHLHFEIREYGSPKDPLGFLP